MMEIDKEKIMNVVIYTRVSTKEQIDNYSLSTQEKICRDYIEKNGWSVAHLFQEEGESAKSTDRTELLKLLEYCIKNKGKIDVVLVYKLDRISRVSADYQGIRAALLRCGVVLRSVTETINDSAQGKFMENIFAAVAQLDNDVRGERTKAGLQERVRQGLWAWAPPIGYKSSPTGMIIDTERAPFIKKIFEMYSTGKYTICYMARAANRMGIKTKQGNKISPQTLTRILENKLYMGIISVQGWKDEVDGIHEKIISPELFYRVKQVRKGNSNAAGPRLSNNPNYPLKNIAKCIDCKKFLTASKSKGRTRRYSYYHCICGKTRVPKEVLEEKFLHLLKQIQPDSNFIELFREVLITVWRMKQRTVLVELQKIEKELSTLKEMKARLIEKNLIGVISDADYKEQIESLSSRIVTKEIERSEIRIEETDIDYLVSVSEELFTKVSTIWLDASFENKLVFQRLLFPRGILYDGEIIGTEELGFPFKLISSVGLDNTNLVPRRGIEPLTYSLEGSRSIR